MKKLTADEFHKRMNEVAKATRIFKPITNNITEAFEIYQQILAEEQMEIFVTNNPKQRDIPSMVEGEVDKPCPVCGRKMRRYKPCCGSPNGFTGCLPCGWKE